MMSDIILQLQQVKKSFDDAEIIKGIDLAVNRGEFITLLGPSGCGKTTTLRIISGLESPDSGKVLLEGKDVTDAPPNKRDINTVFQNYALFPHMTVEDNVGYSMRIKRKSKAEIRSAVARVLDIVQLSGFEKRRPHELSGGQRQRIAIARAIINEPKILLLDEPLGALDLNLRRQMQIELKRIQKQLGITFIYITHDQEEAINMSDRIAVMRGGVFEQIGTPSDIYDRPLTGFVAGFVGNANILEGTVESTSSDIAFINHSTGKSQAVIRGEELRAGQNIRLAIRSEQVKIEPAGNSLADGIVGTVREKSFAGGMLRIEVDINGKEFIVSRHGINSEIAKDEKVLLSWLPENAVFIDMESADEK